MDGGLDEERAEGLNAVHALGEAAEGAVVFGGVDLAGEDELAGEGEVAVLGAAADDVVGGAVGLQDGVVGEELGLTERANAAEREGLTDAAGRLDDPIVGAGGLLEAVEEEVDHAGDTADERQSDEGVALGVGHAELRHAGAHGDGERLGDVRGVLRGDLDGGELGADGHTLHEAVEDVAHAGGLGTDEEGAIDVVVHAADVEGGGELKGAGGIKFADGLDFHHVLLGGGDGGLQQGLAVRARHEVGAGGEIGRELGAGGVVGRVEEAIGAVALVNGHDGVVEEGHRHLLVAGAAGMDDDGIGVEAGLAEHGDQEDALVAADAVTIIEGQGDIVGFEAGGLFLGDDAHVADLLGHEGEERLDLRVAVLALGQLAHLGVDGGGGRHVAVAEAPVPLGDLFPGGEGGEADALEEDFGRGHLLFGEALRHIARHPAVERAAIGEGFAAARDRAGHLVQQGLAAQGQLLGRHHGERGVGDGAVEALKDAPRVIGVRDARAHRAEGRNHVQRVAHGDFRHRQHHALGLGVIDVRVGAVVARGDGHVRREVNGLDRAIRADNLRLDELGLGVALLEPQGHHAQLLRTLVG